MVENVSPGKTWEALKTEPNAQLVDVRTDVEWNFVGVPDRQAGGAPAMAGLSLDAAQHGL